MRFKMLHKTCIALILYIGFGLSSANATAIIIDWTGECDDCQGIDGPNTVPLEASGDGHYQTVYGQLKLRFEGKIEDLGTLTNENFVSFYYGGSNILSPFTFTAAHLDHPKNTFFAERGPAVFSATLLHYDDGTLGFDGFSLKNLLVWPIEWPAFYALPREIGRSMDDLISLKFGRDSDVDLSGNWSLGVPFLPLVTEVEVDPSTNPDQPTNLPDDCEHPCGFRDFGIDSKFSNIVVPEPANLAIFALGIMGLALRRFKKQS